MVRVTDFKRKRPSYDKDDTPRPLRPQKAKIETSKNPRSEARRLKRKSLRERDKQCFVCREKGHLSQDCPSKEDPRTSKTCYRCGGTDHSLKDCKKRLVKDHSEELLPFAKCYVCDQSGHLAGSCPLNEKGLYPDGGGCKLCGTALSNRS